MPVLYDKIAINKNIVLDLPFREGIGTITQDIAKPHHPITLVNAPTWTELASGLTVLVLDGTTQYLQCLNADCLDLDFLNGDFSVGGWINWTVDHFSQIIIGRYEVDVSGWEVYLYAGATDILTLRHHHAAGATQRTGAYSHGWTPGTNWHFGISRSGASVTMSKNGEPVTVTSDAMIDPETCAQNLRLGTRFDASSDFFKNKLWRPKVWRNYAMTETDWRIEYQLQRTKFV